MYLIHYLKTERRNINKYIVIDGDLNTLSPSIINRSSKQKISKTIMDLNRTISQFDQVFFEHSTG